MKASKKNSDLKDLERLSPKTSTLLKLVEGLK